MAKEPGAGCASDDVSERLTAVRSTMAQQRLSAFLVPRADAHRGEQVASCDERMKWLTGFSGSAGLCVVASHRAALFVDGRYALQAPEQVDPTLIDIHELQRPKICDWIRSSVPNDSRVGFDPWLHTKAEIHAMRQELLPAGLELQPVSNPVDIVWTNRPAPPNSRIVNYPVDLAGESSQSKRARIAKIIRSSGTDAAVITLPDSIAWLLNIRASDLRNSPVALAFAIIRADGKVKTYLNMPRSISKRIKERVNAFDKSSFLKDLEDSGTALLVDPDTAPIAVFDRLAELNLKVVEQTDPCILAKAVKNDVEISHSEVAHQQDGAAVVEFLAWLAQQDRMASLTELDIVSALAGFRKSIRSLKSESFDTIAASGPNAAMVHYKATPSTNRHLSEGELLLLDSGGQYPDGTTDVTRTIAIGTPSDEHRRCYTLVLKGLIALARARWPKGRQGRHLDAIARYPLWQEGLDFEHGTGHGVGQYLHVHEGPQSLSARSGVELLPGMILSIEPGYYRQGEFGIRIENLFVIQPAPNPEWGDTRSMLEFRNLTWVPLDRNLIDRNKLTRAERQWVDDYHRETVEQLQGNCSEHGKSWLLKACMPLD